MLFWKVPAPNEAMLISGARRSGDVTGFRIVTGKGSLIIPIKHSVKYLTLALQESVIVEECITTQGIRIMVKAVAAFKVGDDPISISNAARRFLSEQAEMSQLVGKIFAGHLRSIIGSLTVEEIIRERDRLAQEVKDGSHSEMEKMGIVVDSLLVQEIDDKTGYINNIAAPHAAQVASLARIAAAKADQEATQKEQEALALKAQFVRDTQIKEAGFTAEIEQAKAKASQAGPLSQAKASQEVIAEQTSVAERMSQLTDRKLESEIRRPADAEAYRQRTLAEASRDSTKMQIEADAFRLRTEAEAHRDEVKFNTEAKSSQIRELAEAEAEAQLKRARAESDSTMALADGEAYKEREIAKAESEANEVNAKSLANGNQQLIAANLLIEQLPQLVEASAKAIASSNLTVLNGSQGVSEMLAGLIAQGITIYDSLRNSTAVNGTVADVDVPVSN